MKNKNIEKVNVFLKQDCLQRRELIYNQSIFGQLNMFC